MQSCPLTKYKNFARGSLGYLCFTIIHSIRNTLERRQSDVSTFFLNNRWFSYIGAALIRHGYYYNGLQALERYLKSISYCTCTCRFYRKYVYRLRNQNIKFIAIDQLNECTTTYCQHFAVLFRVCQYFMQRYADSWKKSRTGQLCQLPQLSIYKRQSISPYNKV